jgi:hypothetical protein
MRIDIIVGFLLFVGIVVTTVAGLEPAEEREFSAEIVKISPTSERLSGRIYSGQRKLRTESISGGRTTVMIYDFGRSTAHLLNPGATTYFEFPYAVDEFQSGDFYTHSRDQPCGSGYQATSMGSEEVNGRMAEKWRCEMTRLPKYMENKKKEHLRMVFMIDPWHIWYDMEHSLMVRYLRYDGNGREIRNVRMEPQPDHLFVVPPDYTKDQSPSAAILSSLAGG